MLALLLACAAALAATLPGVPLAFEQVDTRWTLGADLPAPIAAAGAQPGWTLVAVDDLAVADFAAVQRAVAAGPAREIRLRFQPGDAAPETILVLRRQELVLATKVGRAPPDGTGDPVPDVFWSLAAASWAVDDGAGVRTADVAAVRGELQVAGRTRNFEGATGDFLLAPGADGLDVYAVEFPRGTPDLPTCDARVPETCLTSGRAILADLGDRPGAREEALRQLVVGCESGVHRACYEAVAVEDPTLGPAVEKCVGGELASCASVARERLAANPEDPPDLVVGLLDLACEMEGSGTLGERLRRIEDVGASCALLADAHDARGTIDRALLALDQACVVGRAEACEEATSRRQDAFAARIVRECEDKDVPIAPSCVELGRLLQAGPVRSSSLDDFSAYLRGCQLGSADGCLALGDYVDRWGITHPRVVDAEKVLGASCADGEQRACLGAAHLLVRHDPRSDAYGEALVLFDGACDGGIGAACVAGAEQRRIGQAKKVEAADQIAMWTTACDRSFTPGCAGLGERLERDKELPGAFTAWNRACELGDAHTCSELGPLVARKHDPWPDEQPAESYLKRGCEGGDPEGCYWLAEDTLVRSGEPPESTYVLLERSCAGEYGAGCGALANVHLQRQTSFDDEIAARHLDTACANGDYDSCKILGAMYLRGKGVERDRARANELLERFRLNADRKLMRLGATIGIPNVAGGELELVLPIPVGPALSISGNGTWLPQAGAVLVLLDGEESPKTAPNLQVLGATVRLYPNHQARGLYGAGGITQITVSGGEPAATRERLGWSARLGVRNDSGALYTGVEMGIGQYGVVDLNDFDEDEKGKIPLIVPTLSFSIGLAPF